MKTQYIDKSALVAEIKSRISNIEISQKAGLIKKRDADKKIFLFKNILSFIIKMNLEELKPLIRRGKVGKIPGWEGYIKWNYAKD